MSENLKTKRVVIIVSLMVVVIAGVMFILTFCKWTTSRDMLDAESSMFWNVSRGCENSDANQFGIANCLKIASFISYGYGIGWLLDNFIKNKKESITTVFSYFL